MYCVKWRLWYSCPFATIKIMTCSCKGTGSFPVTLFISFLAMAFGMQYATNVLFCSSLQMIRFCIQVSNLHMITKYFRRTHTTEWASVCQIPFNVYIYMFQHSAKSLFDLWLFLLRWPHTPQAFSETLLPSRPLLLESTGQPQHQGLHPLLFPNSVWVSNVPQGTCEHRRYL